MELSFAFTVGIKRIPIGVFTLWTQKLVGLKIKLKKPQLIKMFISFYPKYMQQQINNNIVKVELDFSHSLVPSFVFVLVATRLVTQEFIKLASCNFNIEKPLLFWRDICKGFVVKEQSI